MPRNEAITPKQWQIMDDLDNQIYKLTTWNDILVFLLEGLDGDARKAAEATTDSTALAALLPMYLKMLFMIFDGLRECDSAMDALLKQFRQEVNSK